MSRKLDQLGVTDSERRFGLTVRRAAPLLGSDSPDYARQLLREGGVVRLARGRYSAEGVAELREKRIALELIHPEVGLPAKLIPSDHAPTLQNAA